MSSQCFHHVLCFDPSSHAEEAGFRRPDSHERVAAAEFEPPTLSEKRKQNGKNPPIPVLSSTFPAPLVLPDDDLALDPEYPPQSLIEWRDEEARNAVTKQRGVLYISGPPTIESTVEFIRAWSQPILSERQAEIPHPKTQDIADYLSVFYPGMPVKLLPPDTFEFTAWNATTRKTPRYIGLNHVPSKTITRIRTHASHDTLFLRQINLNDILDAAISALPNDAYALVVIVEQDMYEDADDDFACGRAYGGSRVAVVSGARYHPGLDEVQGVERMHGWPASHCRGYVDECSDAYTSVSETSKQKKKKQKKTAPGNVEEVQKPNLPPASNPQTNTSPMHAALLAHNSLSPSPSSTPSPITLSHLWLSRLAKTASHELGHCFGIDHCVYYACIMQGTASMVEDARQPPYLCPVDLRKVLKAVEVGRRSAGGKEMSIAEREEEWCEGMLGFCMRMGEGGENAFGAFAAWLRGRIEELS
ncbi:hypothetical protein K402DRAFT_396430 [Aulographum hederae CBS 113979]|uniref:Uncharacterized protein n=1 Tax=Aulographum hederae CBS 113979 TaxID=1176131 RepID=A0A6G1GRX4_9PEZI|nr:hypothetical protein K402DRAFT_396430 [Aulographum hederae CBS 113979]